MVYWPWKQVSREPTMPCVYIVTAPGSGQGALNQLLQRNPHLFDSPSDLDDHAPRVFSASEIYNLVRYVVCAPHLAIAFMSK